MQTYNHMTYIIEFPFRDNAMGRVLGNSDWRNDGNISSIKEQALKPALLKCRHYKKWHPQSQKSPLRSQRSVSILTLTMKYFANDFEASAGLKRKSNLGEDDSVESSSEYELEEEEASGNYHETSTYTYNANDMKQTSSSLLQKKTKTS